MQLILGTYILDIKGPLLWLGHMELCKNRMVVEIIGNGVVYQLISTVLTNDERAAGACVYTATKDNCMVAPAGQESEVRVAALPELDACSDVKEQLELARFNVKGRLCWANVNISKLKAEVV